MGSPEFSTNAPVVLVTGCSTGGLGAGMCHAFAMRGCRVFASARKLEKMADLADAGIETLVLDVTRDEDVERAVAHVLATAGRIDILVNNAAQVCMGTMLDLPTERFQEHFNLNVFGTLRLCKAVIPHMVRRNPSQRQGLVINIGSMVGVVPLLWHGAYSMSKAAVHMMTDVLDMECRPLGVNVMLAEPGCFKSNLVDNGTVPDPPDSFYTQFRAAIMYVDAYSQSKNPPPSHEIAAALVERALQRSPPRYFSKGRVATRLWILSVLPRALTLFLVWWAFSGLYTDPLSALMQKAL